MVHWKKGQFFIVGAFIIAGIIIGIGTLSNYVFLQPQPFEREVFNKELQRESRSSVLYALNNSKNVSETMENFSRSYARFARGRVPRSQYFFVYADKNEVDIFYFGEPAQVVALLESAPFTFVNVADHYGDYYRAILPREDRKEMTFTFYGKEYKLDLKARSFSHLMRAEHEKGVYIIQ